jgi:phage-related protein
MYKIVYYKTISNKIPVLEYIEDQEAIKVAKIRNSFRLIMEFGIESANLNNKKIKGKRYKGLHQLTIKSSRIIYSIFYNKLLLLHAFTKKTNSTPKKELEIAMQRLKDYMEN